MNRREFVLGAAALALAPDAFARRFGGTLTALVTADLESHVVALDLTTGRRLREIATIEGPRSIERVGNDALVAHTGEGVLTIIDGATLRIRRVLSGFREPRYVASARDARHAFVTESARGALAVVDLHDARVVSRLSLGGPARHLSTDGSGFLWTSLGNKAERVAVVDVRGRRPRLIRRFAPPFLAHDVGLGPSRRWVTGGSGRRIALYDGSRPVALFPADAPPQHVTFIGGRAFVTSGDDGTLHVHDARTGRILRTARIPVGSYNVQNEGGVVLMPSLSRGTLCIADARGNIVRTVNVARSSHDACFVMSA